MDLYKDVYKPFIQFTSPDTSNKLRGVLISKEYPKLYVKFGLNPNSLSDSKIVNWAFVDRPGQESPFSIYSGGGARKMSFKLIFDSVAVNYGTTRKQRSKESTGDIMRGEFEPETIVAENYSLEEALDLEIEKLMLMISPSDLINKSDFTGDGQIQPIGHQKAIDEESSPTYEGFNTNFNNMGDYKLFNPASPLVFFWGKYILEVIPTGSISVEKSMIDNKLNTTHAEVNIELQLLDDKDSYINRAFRIITANKIIERLNKFPNDNKLPDTTLGLDDYETAYRSTRYGDKRKVSSKEYREYAYRDNSGQIY